MQNRPAKLKRGDLRMLRVSELRKVMTALGVSGEGSWWLGGGWGWLGEVGGWLWLGWGGWGVVVGGWGWWLVGGGVWNGVAGGRGVVWRGGELKGVETT